ncbi:MAG TPA: DUF3459 domain-containing protein, partial [Jatrophihabitans sp.]|nr:DUF3459 domain-containing protein [Jatrophihabitans sp.]
GRLAEFAGHGWDTSQMIDPQDPRAYRSAILDWAEPGKDGHAEMLDLYKRLLRLRAAEPDLRAAPLDTVRIEFDEDARWVVIHRGAFRVAVNLADRPQPVPAATGEVVLATGPATPGDDGLILGSQAAAIVRTVIG